MILVITQSTTFTTTATLSLRGHQTYYLQRYSNSRHRHSDTKRNIYELEDVILHHIPSSVTEISEGFLEWLWLYK